MFIFRLRGMQLLSRPSLKMSWFDRNVIKTRWPKFNKNPLQHAGNLVMRIARGSIKRRLKLRGKPSAIGSPPYSRQPGGTPPFKMIFSLPYRLGTAQAVGMVGFGGNAGGDKPPPGLMEHGGVARRKIFTNLGRKRRQNGHFGKNRVQYKERTVKYPERPFMWPAVQKAKQILPGFWLNSVSRG